MGPCNSSFSSNHVSAFVPHPLSHLPELLFHSFIFYCLNSDGQSRLPESELFLIITSLSASICIPLAFLPLGILLLSLPLSQRTPPPSLPPSLALSLTARRCLPVSSFSFWRSCAPHCSPSPPPQFALFCFFISLSRSLSCFLSVSSCKVL